MTEEEKKKMIEAFKRAEDDDDGITHKMTKSETIDDVIEHDDEEL